MECRGGDNFRELSELILMSTFNSDPNKLLKFEDFVSDMLLLEVDNPYRELHTKSKFWD